MVSCILPVATNISLAEKRLGFSLPESLREFYRYTNGASIHDNMWEFFTLEDLAMHNSDRHEPPVEIQCRHEGSLRSRSLMIFADVMTMLRVIGCASIQANSNSSKFIVMAILLGGGLRVVTMSL
ncbi:MAG: SMI1/KNR4 family protein [Verrucomicrobiaceae bacterium]|nr:MAG: SMI1/KNR4 family protein [Verrucomicrobiaceae bacterium]